MHAKDMLKICQRYAKDIPKICQIYAKDMLGVNPRLQIQDNYLKQRYAKDMQRYDKDKETPLRRGGISTKWKQKTPPACAPPWPCPSDMGGLGLILKILDLKKF